MLALKGLGRVGQFVREFFSGYEQAEQAGVPDPEAYLWNGRDRIQKRLDNRGRSRIRAALTQRPDLFSVLGSSQQGGL